jgi:phage gp36-like protein
MNNYCSIADLFRRMDRRTALQLSNDENSQVGLLTTVQELLDDQASELDTYLSGRVGLPLALPVAKVLTKWVAAKTSERLFARRNDIPAQVKEDAAWADKWIGMFMDGRVALPDVQQVLPALQDSDSFSGSSIFDEIFGTLPPRAPQSANPGYTPNQSSGINVSTD